MSFLNICVKQAIDSSSTLFSKKIFGIKQLISQGQRTSVVILNRHVTTTSSSSYDVVISGSGMVGSAMACALGKHPHLAEKKVLLLEGAPKKIYAKLPEYSNRVCALNPSTRMMMENVGAWEHIEAGRYKAVKRMQIWESCSDAMITFNQDDMSEDLAYIIENDLTLNSFIQEIESVPERVETRYSARVAKYKLPSSESDELVQVTMDSGETITAKLLIGADGFKSQVRSSMDVKYIGWEYGQMGVVATLKLAEVSENNVAWQRFLPTGPIALLPLTDELSSLVWSTTNEEADRLLKLSDEEFVDSLNHGLWDESYKSKEVEPLVQKFEDILQNFLPGGVSVRQLPPSIAAVQENSRAAFPLGLGHSTKYIGPRVVLIGDAAHRVHPMAGQGVNLGFGDVQCLTDILVKAVEDGQDIGSLSNLMFYETKRQRYNLPTMAVIDCLQKLYGTTFFPFVLARSLGVQLLNALTPVKKKMIEHASG